jgi:hypothetical protein
MMEIYNDWILVSSLGLLFSYLFVFDPYQYVIDRFPYKPLNCVLCLTFWSTLLLYSAIGLNPLFAIYSAFIAELSYRKLVNE